MASANIRNKHGFTMLEVIIAMMVGLMIIATLATAFFGLRSSYDDQEELVEMMQTARAAMDTMSREIRMAGYDPTEFSFDGLVDADSDGILDANDAEQIKIVSDLNGDGDTGDSNENITYAYDSANLRITRNTGGGAQPFAENVASLNLEYYSDQGTTVTTTGDIRQVEISITVQNAMGDESRTLTSMVKPRNLG